MGIPAFALFLATLLFVFPVMAEEASDEAAGHPAAAQAALDHMAANPEGLEPDTFDTLEKIKWKAAPEFVRTQVTSVITKCTQGTLTPDHVIVYRYVAQGAHAKTPHYMLDFSEFKGHPYTLTCSHGTYPCKGEACLMQIYTQDKPGNFVPSLRPYALSFNIEEIVNDGRVLQVVHVKQPKKACRNFGTGTTDDCSISFTWINNKFRYFGLVLNDEQDPDKLKERAEKFKQQLEDAKKDGIGEHESEDAAPADLADPSYEDDGEGPPSAAPLPAP